MRSVFSLFLFLTFVWGSILPAAQYKGKNIDGRHWNAEIWIKDSTQTYSVDVVFVEKAANLAFPEHVLLPPMLQTKLLSDKYLTLYLFSEIIEYPDRVVLRQVKPPLVLDNSDPSTWETDIIWVMKLDLKNFADPPAPAGFTLFGAPILRPTAAPGTAREGPAPG